MATKATGAKLKRQDVYASNGSGAYTQITKAKNIQFDIQWETEDTSDLDLPGDWTTNETTVRTIQPVTFDLYFEPGNATHDEITGILNDFANDTLRFWQVQLRTGKARQFEGKVTQIGEAVQAKGLIMTRVTITPRGALTYATAA